MARSTQMCRSGTPVEDHTKEFGLYVKYEHLACISPGPPFSKARGVFKHVQARPEAVIGVLDTSHSQGGWAVARACQLLGKQCVLFYPVRKAEQDHALKHQQRMALNLGARLRPLPAGRSAILYHQAKKELAEHGPDTTYMMPNALKLPESVTETARELGHTKLPQVGTAIVPCSSGTIAAGVLAGLYGADWKGTLVLHMGYSRSPKELTRYVTTMAGVPPGISSIDIVVVDEKYEYKDAARPGELPPFPCNVFYDLKTFRWWQNEAALPLRSRGPALLWNIG